MCILNHFSISLKSIMFQVSYISSDDTLSNKAMYPTFYTTASTISFINSATLEILRLFNWKRIGLINSDAESHSIVCKFFTLLIG